MRCDGTVHPLNLKTFLSFSFFGGVGRRGGRRVGGEGGKEEGFFDLLFPCEISFSGNCSLVSEHWRSRNIYRNISFPWYCLCQCFCQQPHLHPPMDVY